MRWTKQHSKNAVASKERLRQQRSTASWPDKPRYKEAKLGRFIPDFTINIRTRRGDRLKITATRYGKQMLTGEGIKSVRQITRGIEALLRHCTP